METSEIKDWHAHVYFDAASRDAALSLRERIEVRREISSWSIPSAGRRRLQ
jgi:aromatic ring-cleaving dioxygenase